MIVAFTKTNSVNRANCVLIDVNFIRASPTASVPSAQPLTRDEEFQDDLSEASTYYDANIWHWYVLNAVYRRLPRQGMVSCATGDFVAVSATLRDPNYWARKYGLAGTLL